MIPSTQATNPVADGLLLKGGNAFLVADPTGWIPAQSACGLYLEDTRHLSAYTWDLDGDPFTLREMESPELFHARMVYSGEGASGLAITRTVALASHLLETIRIADSDRSGPLRLRLGADFQDVFEVRGLIEPQRRTPSIDVAPHVLTFVYDGADGIRRWTRASFYPPPDEISEGAVVWKGDSASAQDPVTAKIELGTGPLPRLGGMVLAEDLASALRKDWEARLQRWQPFQTPDDRLMTWLRSAAGDAASLMTRVGRWSVPAAGLPWYATAFGRDSLIFGLQTVHIRADVSMEILRFLATHQGRALDGRRGEAPGKILHELRRGELAGTGRIPHTPYYGSVDATPLFLCLLAEVYRWTGDQTFLRDLYPAAERAFSFVRREISRGPGGFLAYTGHTPPGLRHQGWKDGEWGILRPDGSQPEFPIAPCEVQGYAYWGLREFSRLAGALGEEDTAREAADVAKDLRLRFDPAFWLPHEATYAIALEGAGTPVATVASNPGHLLLSGILTRDRATALTTRMLREDLFSGWGIRTLSDQAGQYDPFSYHNGSVWPHDTGLIAWGLSRSAFAAPAHRLFEGLRDAAGRFPLSRLPELFGGHSRVAGRDPVRVPEASPVQAWVTGVPFLLLRAVLGLEADAAGRVLELHPVLPRGLDRLELRDLHVGRSRLSLVAQGEGAETQVSVEEESGPRIEVRTD